MIHRFFASWPISEVVVERLGWTLLHSLWQFTAIAVLAAVALRWMRRSSATRRYGVLVCLMASMAFAPFVTAWLQLTRLPSTPVAVATAESPAAMASNDIAAAATVNQPPVPAGGVSSGDAAATLSPAAPDQPTWWGDRAVAALTPWMSWIVGGWCVGVVIVSLRPLLGWRMLRRLRTTGVGSPPDEVLAVFHRLAQRLGMRRAVGLWTSTLAQGPMVVGYVRPVILLPVSLVTSIPVAQLETILAHEWVHIQRHDFVVNLLQTVFETLFFYHPAVWWLSHRIRIEREHCCDDAVVELLGNRVEYGRALLAIEQFGGRSTPLALSATDGSLLGRIERLAGITPGRDLRSADRWPATALSLAGLCLAVVLNWNWNAVAQESDERLQQPAGRFVAKLDGGIEVELIGVAFHPFGEQPAGRDRWWQPDGGLLAENPTLPEDGSFTVGSPQTQADCREFLIQILGLPENTPVRTSYGVSSATGSSMISGVWTGYHGAGPFTANTATIQLAIASGPQGPMMTIDTTARKHSQEPLSPPLQLLDDHVIPIAVRDDGGKTTLLVESKPYGELLDLAYWSISAVDMAGVRHRKTTESVPYPGPRELGFPLPLAQIQHFEYQLQPYNQRVVFDGVGLQPGTKANVVISTESSPAIPTADTSTSSPLVEPASSQRAIDAIPVAELPEGVSVEFVGITKNTRPAGEGWRPNGQPIGDVGYWPATIVLHDRNTSASFTENGDHPEPDEDAIDCLFRFNGLKSQPSINFQLPTSGGSYRHFPVSDPYSLRVSGRLREPLPAGSPLQYASPDDELRVAWTDEPWGKWLQITPEGDILNPLTEDDRYHTTYEKVQVVGIEPHDRAPNGIALVLRQPANANSLYALEIRGVDSQEATQWVLQWEGSQTPPGVMEGRWGLASSEQGNLQRYEFRLRPYRYWARFTGVSLQPAATSQATPSTVTARPVVVEAGTFLDH